MPATLSELVDRGVAAVTSAGANVGSGTTSLRSTRWRSEVLPAAFEIAKAVKNSSTVNREVKEVANKLMWTAAVIDRVAPRPAGLGFVTPSPASLVSSVAQPSVGARAGAASGVASVLPAPPAAVEEAPTGSRTPGAETPAFRSRAFLGAPAVRRGPNLTELPFGNVRDESERPATGTPSRGFTGSASAAARRAVSAFGTAASAVARRLPTIRTTRKAEPDVRSPYESNLFNAKSPLLENRGIPSGLASAIERYEPNPDKREAAAKKKADAETQQLYDKFKKDLSPEERKKLLPIFTNADGYKAINWGPLSERYRVWSSGQKRGGGRNSRKTRRRN